MRHKLSTAVILFVCMLRKKSRTTAIEIQEIYEILFLFSFANTLKVVMPPN